MKPQFSSDFFRGNRAKLQALFTGTAPIVITANGLLQRNSDVTYPFRQDSSFWYLTGIEEPDVVLVMDRSKEYLIVPNRHPVADIFDGAIDIQNLSDTSGISLVYEADEGWKLLAARIKKVKHVATLAAPAAHDELHGLYTNPARSKLIERIKTVNSNVELLDLRAHLMRMRMVKQPPEIQAIRSAVNLTTKAFRKIERRLATLEGEQQVQNVLDQTFNSQQAQHAYQPIVAGGVRACTLHYIRNNMPINEGDLLLIDAGAEVNNYAADITRTYCKGVMSKRQQAVVRAVEEALLLGISKLKPGVSFMECEQKVRDFVGEKLRELGLIKSITKETISQYYPHSPHFLGLDTHDVGDYNIPLEPGMVVTLEPGIYIPKEKIGVRIEDDILITANGREVLSKSLPKAIY